ncbi:MAG TPA: cytidylate kinase-like family protein [Gaiellaceae bacterium]|nr:cytidylate kinase-like family protein [Gaiellaceae bacterium]
MPGRAICISHATGAGGAEVARAVAEELGYRYVDDEVISEAAEWAHLDPAFVASAERRKPLVARLLGGFGEPGSEPRLPTGDPTRGLPGDAELRHLIASAVGSFARQGSVVLVAHAASFAAADLDVLRVLVTASPETRAGRLAADRGVDSRAAKRLIADEDAGRAHYLKRFYGVAQELPTHFDLVVNTDILTATDAADVIVAAA